MKKLQIKDEDFELPIEKMKVGNKVLKLRNEKINKNGTKKNRTRES